MTGTAPYEELAHAILNTYGPHARFHALCERFPKIGRHDVFFGISLAWAIADADTVHADRGTSMTSKPAPSSAPPER